MRTISRQTGWAGMSASAVLFVAMLIAGSSPDSSMSAEDLRIFAQQYRDAILMTAALYQVAIPFLFVFAAGLSQLAAGKDGEMAALAWGGFGGNIGLQAVAVAGSTPFIAAAWRGDSDALLQLTYDQNLLGLYALSAGFSLASVAPVTIAAIATRALPMWVGAFAAILALANIAELVGFLFYGSGPMALGAGPGLIAVPAWLAWMLAVSVCMLRK